MKIVWGDSNFDRDKEVKRIFRLQRKWQEKHGVHDISKNLLGVSENLAHHLHKCEDCGKHYWDTDEYGGPHIGCRGQLKKAGFS